MHSYLFVFSQNKPLKFRKKIQFYIDLYFAEKRTKLLLTQSRQDAIDRIGKHTDYDVVVAIGGDGTINSVAQAVVGTTHTLGIIPMGSGNGLARNLGLPLKMKAAFECLSKAVPTQIDAIQVNDTYALNVFGLGFDAEVVHHFETMPVRGFLGYTLAVIKTLTRFKRYTVNQGSRETTLFLLVIANGEQYGFNTRIAPLARLDDGQLDMVEVQKLKWWLIPRYVHNLATNKRIQHSSISYDTTTECSLTIPHDSYYQLDGEGFEIKAHMPLNVSVSPKSVTVLIPKIR